MKPKFYIAVILCTFLLNVNVKADDTASDDSCLNSITYPNVLLSNVVSLGELSIYSAFFNMTGGESQANSDQTTALQSNPSAAPVTAGCSNTTYYSPPSINFYFTDASGTATLYNWINGESSSFTTPAGIPGYARAVVTDNTICVQFYTITAGYQNIGCKSLPSESSNSTTINCYTGSSCASSAYSNSRAPVPFGAAIVQCTIETLDVIFQSGPTVTCTSSDSMITGFSTFQNSMRNIVEVCLTLYIILFGFKVALSPDNTSKGDAFMALIKFALVLYFSIGIQQSGTDSYGNPVYSSGVTEILQPLSIALPNFFADIVFNGASETGSLCYYDPNDYKSGYSYLSLWDSLDCRFIEYLGLSIGLNGNANTTTGAGIFEMMLLAFFSFNLLFMLLTIIFVMFFLSVTIYFMHTYIIALIAITLLVYIAPIFVPFALFSQTRSYFDSWVKMMLSFSLQPMIIAAFIALMLVAFDGTMYGNCLFEPSTSNVGGRDFVTYNIVTPSEGVASSCQTQCEAKEASATYCSNYCSNVTCQTQCEATGNSSSNCSKACSSTTCENSFGYILANASDVSTSINAVFFDYVFLNSKIVSNMMDTLMLVTFFSILFYKFSKVLTEFTGDITGGVALGKFSIGPTALFDKAAAMAAVALKYTLNAATTSKTSNSSNQGASVSDSKPR